eukprot:347250-Chlamydomonas_euryale.AAC.4
MGHVLRMNEKRLPRQVFDCSVVRPVAEAGRRNNWSQDRVTRTLKIFLGCPALESGVATRKAPVVAPLFGTLKLTGRTKLIPWPDIRVAAAERALDRYA